MIEFVPATPELMARFYGKPIERTVRGFVGMEDGEVLGIGGYYLTQESIIVFSEISPKGMTKKKSIVKGIKKVLQIAKQTGLPIYAVPDVNIESASKLLKPIGFIELKPGVYRWLV